MKSRLLILAIVLVGHGIAVHQSVAQAPNFDGQWVADVPVQGKCPASHLTLFVAGRSIIGSVYNSSGTFPISGHIDAGGNGTIKIVDFAGRIKFSGDRFAADYFNACGERRAIGKKLGPGASSIAYRVSLIFLGGQSCEGKAVILTSEDKTRIAGLKGRTIAGIALRQDGSADMIKVLYHCPPAGKAT